jgi:ABC-type branched-subunit amino acid transport system permease subunit
MWAVMTIAAMGLNLTLGYAGQVSLAQAPSSASAPIRRRS